MRQASQALATAMLFAISSGLLASNSIVQPPSYDALMAMPEVERRDTFRAMDLTARLSLIQTHIDRWLSENRNRLAASQVALVTEVRNNLTAERHASDQMKALERRMLCELWRSDAIALRLIQDPPMSSSWLNDLHEWATDCVLAKAIDAVF